jgi:hypothetical protein
MGGSFLPAKWLKPALQMERQRIPAPLRDAAPLSLQDITVLSELGKPSHLG